MKRFLIFLMAAVLVLTTATFPAAGALPLEQEETVQPAALGDRTTYHICFRDDGRMLTASGSVYTNQYIQNDVSMQWIFEEYLPSTYIVYSAASPSYALTVDPTTCSVTLGTYTSGNNFQLWTLISSSSGAVLETFSSDSRVSGKKLYSSGYPFTASVQSSGSSLELISPSALVPITSFSWDNARTYVEVSKQLTPPTYSPANATYTDASWFEYSSANPSICTVDQNGVVTGVSAGSAVIQVTHKIYRTTKSCYVDVWPLIEYDCVIYYDEGKNLSHTTLSNQFAAATAAFKQEFGIEFTLTSISCESDLNKLVNEENCTLSDAQICTTACAPLNQCEEKHHKSGSRILGLCDYESAIFEMRLVSHILCGNLTPQNTNTSVSGHQSTMGTADAGTDTVVVSAVTNSVTAIMQHELSHNLGADHTTCEGGDCILYNDSTIGVWCSSCASSISRFP